MSKIIAVRANKQVIVVDKSCWEEKAVCCNGLKSKTWKDERTTETELVASRKGFNNYARVLCRFSWLLETRQ